MLRTLFVLALLIGFALVSLRGPLEALILYLWLAYFRPEEWVWTYQFRLVPLSFIAGGYLLLRLLFSSVRFRFDFRVGLLLAFFVLALISGLNSNYFDTSMNQLTILGKSFVVSYILAILTDNWSKLRLIAQTIAFSLAFEGAKQGWATLLLNPGGLNQNAIVFLGDNNGVAVGMLMLVPIFVMLGRTTTHKPEKWLYWFFAIGVLYRAISTYSRGGFLAASAMALVYILRSPRRVPALAGGALAALLIFTALPQSYWDRMNTIKGTETEEGTVDYEGSAESRLHFWQVGFRMANAMPIGVGPGAFNAAYDRFDWMDGFYGRGRAVHSSWFGTMAELGYPGLFLLLWILFASWRTCARAQTLAKRGLIPPELGHFGAGLEAAFAAFVVGGTFLSFQYIEMLWHFIALAISLNFNMQAALEAETSGTTARVGADAAPAYIPAMSRAGAPK